MNCKECIKPNNIPNCFTGAVTITVGYLDAAYFNTTVLVKIVNVATGKERFESVATNGAGVVTFTAFNMASHYTLEVLDAATYQSLTIYSTETDSGAVTSSCCVEFQTLEYNTSTDLTFNFETCT